MPPLDFVHVRYDPLVRDGERVSETQPCIEAELRFVRYGKRVLPPWLSFEKVDHGIDGVGLEGLMLEFELHAVI